MSFLAVLLALFLERVLIDQDEWRRASWFASYLARLRGLPFGERLFRGVLGVIAALAVPLLLVALVQSWLGGSLAGVPELLFATAVLIYCLGPGNLDAQIQALVESLDDKDEGLAQGLAHDLVDDEPALGDSTLLGQVVRAIPVQALHRLFGVLFWFLMLGPVGALLYRLARHLDAYAAARGDLDAEFRAAALRLPAILDWAPARAEIAAFSLAGSFEDTLAQWRDSAARSTPDELVRRCAAAALRIDGSEPPERDGVALIERSSALVWRSILIWVGLLGLVTVAYWAS
jgi:membrane protein required for beta-lactamase induction